MLTLIGLAAFVGSRSVKVPALKIEVTAGDAFTFLGLLAVGPLAAPIVALAGTASAVIASDHFKRRRLKAIFNMASVTLSAAASAWAHQAILAGEQLGSYTYAVAVVVAGVTFGLVNTLLVALVMRIATGTSVVSNWLGFGPWAVGSSMGSLLIALGLLSLIPSVGFAGLVLGLFGTRLVTTSIQAFRDSTGDVSDLTVS
ncbi:MAG: hypothetical protein OEV00_03220 [Acidobacteriota bacterium]|nr:hypothetical protein [Acidobacteriota bacterium]MDH3784320.1 hypothetical protein [Acidobacteriota bacterium]